MKERGILFSAPMVLALLAGTKTQTRRALKPRPPFSEWYREVADCPYGVPGDRLWVREAWARVGPGVIFRASDADHNPGQKWKPGIHLFRVDSRITLEITDVRVQRLHDISEEDAQAEGVPACGWGISSGSYEEMYSRLWESVNGLGSWEANPFVWALTFARVSP